jgi:hypothetical protein
MGLETGEREGDQRMLSAFTSADEHNRMSSCVATSTPLRLSTAGANIAFAGA